MVTFVTRKSSVCFVRVTYLAILFLVGGCAIFVGFLSVGLKACVSTIFYNILVFKIK